MHAIKILNCQDYFQHPLHKCNHKTSVSKCSIAKKLAATHMTCIFFSSSFMRLPCALLKCIICPGPPWRQGRRCDRPGPRHTSLIVHVVIVQISFFLYVVKKCFDTLAIIGYELPKFYLFRLKLKRKTQQIPTI